MPAAAAVDRITLEKPIELHSLITFGSQWRCRAACRRYNKTASSLPRRSGGDFAGRRRAVKAKRVYSADGRKHEVYINQTCAPLAIDGVERLALAWISASLFSILKRGTTSSTHAAAAAQRLRQTVCVRQQLADHSYLLLCCWSSGFPYSACRHHVRF